MNVEQKVNILSRITTRDEAGRHFTSAYAMEDLLELEDGGYLSIHRPIHEQTGIAYSQEYWSMEITDDGLAMVEAYPDYQ